MNAHYIKRDKMVDALLKECTTKFEFNPTIQNYNISNASAITARCVFLENTAISSFEIDDNTYFVLFDINNDDIHCSIFNIDQFKNHLYSSTDKSPKIYNNIIAIFNHCFT